MLGPDKDSSKLDEYLAKAWATVFHGPVPVWASFLFIVILFLVKYHEPLFKIFKAIRPYFRTSPERAREARLRRFALGIIHELKVLDEQDTWEDERYAELEVEVDTPSQPPSLRQRIFRRKQGLRRVRSLTRALAASNDRVVLLQGEPGSGKSVALRHLALRLARKSARRWPRSPVIPLYINLRALQTLPEAVTADSIRDFVLASINHGRSAVVDRFLEEEFERGLANGEWLFLFDSFDEIPAVLSSTEHDQVVRNYRDAISDFLHPLNKCRGVIASRLFRGPTGRAWSRFRIMALAERRQRVLVARSGLNPTKQAELIGSLALASDDLKSMSSNPLFLRMLCEYMAGGETFPVSSFEVFRTYVSRRLSRDKPLVLRRFGTHITDLENTAQLVAFVMSADASLGLAPTRAQLRMAIEAAGSKIDADFDRKLDALEYIRIARSDTRNSGDAQTFSFAHRRLQEYFATAVLLRDAGTISPERLLLDARWREPTVALCQTSPLGELQPLLQAAISILTDDPSYDPLGAHEADTADVPWAASLPLPTTDAVPLPKISNRQLHVIRLLQDGLGSRREELPDPLRDVIRTIVLRLASSSFEEQKLALDLSGVIPVPDLEQQVRRAFHEGGTWIRNAAYWQIGRLVSLPPDVVREIREDLITRVLNQTLNEEWYATLALLQRVRDNRLMLRLARRLHRVNDAELLLPSVVVIYVLAACATTLGLLPTLGIICALALNYAQFRTGVVAAAGIRGQAALRSMAGYFIIGILLLGMLDSTWIVSIACGLTAYTLLWTPGTLIAARQGRFLQPWAWPLPPLVYVVLPLVLAGACAWGVEEMFAAFDDHGLARTTSTMPEWISAVYLLVVAVFMLILVGSAIHKWVLRRRDRRLARHALLPGPVPPDVFRSTLSKMRTAEGKAYLLRHARETERYMKTPEMLGTLRMLARSLDREIVERVARAEEIRKEVIAHKPSPFNLFRIKLLLRQIRAVSSEKPKPVQIAIMAYALVLWPIALTLLPLSLVLWPLRRWLVGLRGAKAGGRLNEPRSVRNLQEKGLIHYRDELHRLIELVRDETASVPEVRPEDSGVYA
ncbi:MAG TPA: NACHT domain-containing protein [Longimicrobium sp.]|nr:NACHT domain-containing protein [Longimicrobium sp.]